MPLALGMMLMNRLNVYNTSTAVTVTESAPYTCGETIHFNVTVTNISNPGHTPTPTGGTVQIYDLNSATVLGTGTLSGGVVTIPVILSIGSFNIVAQYLGTNSSPFFDASASTTPIAIGVSSPSSTTTSITSPSSGFNFCSTENLSFTATVSSGSGTPTGNVQFYYSLDTVTYTLFATSSLSSGSTTAILSANTITGSNTGTEVYFHAIYEGSGCFNPSASSDIDGYAYKNQNTSIVFTSPMDSPGIGYFTMHGLNQVPGVPVVLTMTPVTGSVNDGTVTLYCAYVSSGTPPNFTLPTPPSPWAQVPQGVGVGADVNPVSVTSNTVDFNFTQGSGPTSFFPSDGTYYFVAVYTNTSGCFAGSHTTFTASSAYHIFVNEE